MSEDIKIAFGKDGKAVELNDECCIYCANEETFNKVKEAVEKQVPKKVIKGDYEGGSRYKCPRCGDVWLVLPDDPYCCKCGQALDWSEEE